VRTIKTRRATRTPGRSPASRPTGQYFLRLFVAGATARSRQAVLRVRELREVKLKGRAQLEVIDIYQQPRLAREHQIVATPTLIVVSPPPVRRFIGSLTNLTELFGGVDLAEQSDDCL
jgi:circadian clock protein KaiB